MEVSEVLSRYPYEITIKKIVRSGAQGYGREVKYIKRLDILCRVCENCGENDVEFEPANGCEHRWNKSRKNIVLEIADNYNDLPKFT